jgi:hypothetical protein
VVDFTGEIRRGCERYLALNPDACYREAKVRFFADADWKVVIDTLSPRVFEAAALGCTLVQHEGHYGGVMCPDEHYIRVRRDYSNVADVLDRLRDRGFCRDMARRAHRDLVASRRYGFEAFARWFDGVLEEHVPGRHAVGSLSALRFYADGYLRRRQALVPWGTTLAVLPSAQLVHDLTRRVLEWLPRSRRGALASRLIHNPAGILRKALAAARLLCRDRRLRQILASYVRHGEVRGTLPVHALLDDLLRLDLIRGARQGTLRASQSFTVAWEHHAPAGALIAVSRRNGPATPGGVAADVVGALRQGRMAALVWDHAAVAPQVVCRTGRFTWLTFTLGAGGVYRFRALEALCRADAPGVREALLGILGVGDGPAGRPAP